jgi:uncharacterized membrane protein
VDKIALAGRILFAVSMMGLGTEHFVYDVFVTGRAPDWPAAWPGGVVWAYVSGFIVVASSAALLLGRTGRVAALVLAALILFWAVLRHIPVVVASEAFAPTWTKAVKALAFFGGSLASAATLPRAAFPRDSILARIVNRDDAFIVTATICLAAFMVNNGIQHFYFITFVAALIPAWFPGDAVFWSYAAAIMLFAGAAGMFYRRTAILAALLTGVMVFSWVWIVHVPRISVSVSDNVAVFEAPAIAGIAFMLAALHARRVGAPAQR